MTNHMVNQGTITTALKSSALSEFISHRPLPLNPLMSIWKFVEILFVFNVLMVWIILTLCFLIACFGPILLIFHCQNSWWTSPQPHSAHSDERYWNYSQIKWDPGNLKTGLCGVIGNDLQCQEQRMYCVVWSCCALYFRRIVFRTSSSISIWKNTGLQHQWESRWQTFISLRFDRDNAFGVGTLERSFIESQLQ